jgi:ankyrin repeat protein
MMAIRYAITASAVLLVLCLPAFGAANSPVADAAMKSDWTALQTLLQQKADVNAPQADGATAIQWAAYNGDLEMADLLIGAGANVKAANREGATALQLACINGDAAIIERLIRAGADPNEKGPHGETPIMFAARNGKVDALKIILDHNANVNAKESLRGTTALMWAAEQGHPAAVAMLVQHGADVHAATNFDSKGNRAYLAPSPAQRAASHAAGDAKRLSSAKGAAPAGRGRGAARAGSDSPSTEDLAPADPDAAAAEAAFGRQTDKDGGGLTPLVFAARQDCVDCVEALLEGGADVNEVTHYGWTPLLAAVQNRHYRLARFLLEHGANPNIANNGGWTPLYIATDNRNIESGDYPVRKPDMDHLGFINLLLEKGANVNARVCGVKSTPSQCQGDSTETRTNFTMQWLYEDGATPFLRAAQSGDVVLMKLLLAHGADPKIATANNVTALAVAAGIGWVEGVTYEWSPEENLEAVQLCLDLGISPNTADDLGRAALHGAAHKGRNAVVQLLVDHGANLEAHDNGSRDTIDGPLKGQTWIPLHYSQGLVRVGVQSAIPHPETEAFIKKMMREKGLPIPPDINLSICVTKGPKGCQ